MNHAHRSDKHQLNAITMFSYTILVTILALSYLVEVLNSTANQQVISGIETISAATEEVTAHSNETVEISEKNSDIADEVEAIVTTLNQLAEELSAAK